MLDDVDYPIPGTNSDGGTNIIFFLANEPINTNGLWLEVPTNAYSLASNNFHVLLHNTTNGGFYDVLTKTHLLLPLWTTEMTVTGAVGNLKPVTLGLYGRTNFFVWARTSKLIINMQPLAQEVLAGDTVTFTVAATGDDLSYQWTFNGTNIVGTTGSSLTIANVNAAEAGNYACVVTSATGMTTSQTATLTVDSGNDGPYQTQPIGQRQDYTFRYGVTYHIGSLVQFYGNTTFQPGTIIKFDYTQPDTTSQIMGTVTCGGTAYNPSILTTYDDNAYGEQWSDYLPQTYPTGVPYLDLSQASGDLSLTNFGFATPMKRSPTLPIVDLNTILAYQLATQWLEAVHVDAAKLNKDRAVEIRPSDFWNGLPRGAQLTKRDFVPVYDVSWLSPRNQKEGYGAVAFVELYSPAKKLLQLSIEDQKCVLRPPIVFTNLDALFPGVAPIHTNRPVKLI